MAEAIAPAPLEAAATWTGRVPAGTTHVHVSPTGHPGRFGFRIEAVRRRMWPALLAEGSRRAPRPARSALLTKLIGWAPESDHNLAWAIGAHPLESFATWSARRSRPIECDGLERPRITWAEAPPVRLIVRAAEGDATALERTLDSLRHQRLPRWHAVVIGAPVAASDHDARIAYVASASDATVAMLSDDCWFGVVPAGATLRPEAFALVAERRAREPEARIVYGDEIGRRSADPEAGMEPAPRDRPALSRPSGLRGTLAVHRGRTRGHPARRRLAGACRRGSRSRCAASSSPAPLLPLYAGPQATSIAPQRMTETAAIIVLTRDQPTLLTRLAASIRAKTKPGSYRLVVGRQRRCRRPGRRRSGRSRQGTGGRGDAEAGSLQLLGPVQRGGGLVSRGRARLPQRRHGES